MAPILMGGALLYVLSLLVFVALAGMPLQIAMIGAFMTVGVAGVFASFT